MGLFDLAATDAAVILANEADWAIRGILTSPDNEAVSIAGAFVQINEVVNPDTGIRVAGRHTAFSTTDDRAKAVVDRSKKGWKITVRGGDYRIRHVIPDHTLGIYNLVLEDQS